MSSSLDMSLDDIIRNRKGRGSGGRSLDFRGRRSGSGSGPGPDRHFSRREPIRPRPYPLLPAMQVAEPMMDGRGGGGSNGDRESGTKLYLSNLDYGVSNQDLKVLFSELGELLRYSIHYDRSGRSKGTAEVIFVRQTDALAAIKRYNDVHLDGKPMNIELVGVNFFTPTPAPPLAPIPHISTGNMGEPSGVVWRGQEHIGARGWGRSGDRGFAKGRRRGRYHDEKLTAEALDSDLEKYHLDAMKIN